MKEAPRRVGAGQGEEASKIDDGSPSTSATPIRQLSFPPRTMGRRSRAAQAAYDELEARVCDLIVEVRDRLDFEAWQLVLPLIEMLTRLEIGQIWIHHTGHDTTKGYGTKTREWLLDTAILLQKVTRADTDVSFSLEFTKARERTPEHRLDFEEVTIALVNDEWVTDAKTVKRGNLSPSNKKFLDALTNCYAGGATEISEGRKVVTVEMWRAECEKLGLIEKDKTPKARSWFSRNKRELIERNYIASHFDQYVWKL